MLQFKLLQEKRPLFFEGDHISRLLDLRKELVFGDFWLGDQRLADFRDHLHHLELEVINSVVEQPAHNANSDRGDIVVV